MRRKSVSAQRLLRILSSSPFVLGVICAVFVVNTLRVDENRNPFQDEGLYLFMGHRMIDHILSGVHLSEYPGTYFSGAPGLYPVVGAIADSVGGVPACAPGEPVLHLCRDHRDVWHREGIVRQAQRASRCRRVRPVRFGHVHCAVWRRWTRWRCA